MLFTRFHNFSWLISEIIGKSEMLILGQKFNHKNPPKTKIHEYYLTQILQLFLDYYLVYYLVWRIIIPIFISASGTPKWLVHTLSSIIGLGLLISFFNTNIIFQIGLTLSAWIMLQISHKIGHGCRGLLSLILCVSFNLICELFFATPVDWQSIRGMVVINRVMYKKPLVNEDFDPRHAG